jgi:dolichol-phosphate mannosyltransferase
VTSDASVPGSDGASSRPAGRTIFVVLPAFNEEARIGSLLDHIDESLQEARLAYHVVVVDDGSGDATASIVEGRGVRMPITLCRHRVNLGLGATLRDGLLEAAGRAADRDIVVTMDADDTHTPGLILRMTGMISEGYDVVVASRYRTGSRSIGVPWSRRLLSYGGSWMLRLLFPIRGIRDYTCGYRAYRASALKDAIGAYGDRFVDQDGFQSTLDILLKLRTRPLHFGEVPFLLRYDIKEGATKMDVPRTIRKTLQLILVRRLGR